MSSIITSRDATHLSVGEDRRRCRRERHTNDWLSWDDALLGVSGSAAVAMTVAKYGGKNVTIFGELALVSSAIVVIYVAFRKLRNSGDVQTGLHCAVQQEEIHADRDVDLKELEKDENIAKSDNETKVRLKELEVQELQLNLASKENMRKLEIEEKVALKKLEGRSYDSEAA